MSRPFSLYLTPEAPSVALLVLNPSVLVRTIQVLFLQNGTFNVFPCQPPPSSLHRLHLWFCAPGGFGGRGARSCLLHGNPFSLLSLWPSGGKTEGKRSTCSRAIARGLCQKLVKAGGWKAGLVRATLERTAFSGNGVASSVWQREGRPAASQCLSWRGWPRWEHWRFSHDLGGLLQMC